MVLNDVSDVKIIHNLSHPDGGINKLAWETSVANTSIAEATSCVGPNRHLAKIDLKAAYCLMPMSKSCYDLTGIRWRFNSFSPIVIEGFQPILATKDSITPAELARHKTCQL